jgi:hypothetical protein
LEKDPADEKRQHDGDEQTNEKNGKRSHVPSDS